MELLINNKKQFRKLPYAVVDLAIEEGWVKELSYFLHITSLYGNSIIYNYSSRTLSDKMGISKSAIHKNVKFLLEKGLFKVTDKGHLVGLSINGLRDWVSSYLGKSTGKGLLSVKIHNNIKHTEYNIFARVVLNTINRQKFSSRKRAEVYAIRATIEKGGYISPSDYNKYKSLLSLVENKNTEKANKPYSNENCFVSDSLLSKSTGKSIGTVRAMVSFWVSENLIESTFVKGQCIGVSSNRLAYESLVEARPSEFSSTYLFRNRIVQFNKRIVNYGSSLVHVNPNSILQLKGQ